MFQYKLINGFLTEDQCKTILDYSLNNLELRIAKVLVQNEPIIDIHRKSKISFNKYEHFVFLNDKVMKLVLENVSVNGYEIGWNSKGYQFTSYDSGDYYNWHTDNSNGRYCSVVVQLNDDYEGGDLELMVEDKTLKMGLKMGDAVIFLSNLNHRVTEVLNGTRYSLVNWLILSQIDGYKKSII